MRPKRILAIHVTRIGDTLLGGPSLRALAQAFPEARIDFLGHPKRVEVMEGFPGVRRIAGISKRSAPWRGWWACLGGRPYDLAVVWGKDQALVRYALRVAQRVVALRQADESINRRLFAAVAHSSDDDIPLADWQLRLVEQGLGISTDARYVEYHVSAEEQRWAQTYLAASKAGGARVVGLIVETFHTAPHRDWPIAHFVALVRRLRDYDPALRFVLFGGPLAADKVDALRAVLGEHLLLAAGSLTLRQSAAAMNELDLFVGLDTGPSHIIAALGVPAVVLFHCMRRGPLVLSPRWPERLTMIEHPLATECCSFASSMDAIAPETVFAAACRQLEAGRR